MYRKPYESLRTARVRLFTRLRVRDYSPKLLPRRRVRPMETSETSDTARELLCGGFAGAVGVFVGQPFDFVKVRLQAGRTLHYVAIWPSNTL